MEELIPYCQRETKIHVLASFDPVMDPVVVRTYEDSLERAETKIGVGVLESDHGRVEHEHRRGHRAVGE